MLLGLGRPPGRRPLQAQARSAGSRALPPMAASTSLRWPFGGRSVAGSAPGAEHALRGVFVHQGRWLRRGQLGGQPGQGVVRSWRFQMAAVEGSCSRSGWRTHAGYHQAMAHRRAPWKPPASRPQRVSIKRCSRVEPSPLAGQGLAGSMGAPAAAAGGAHQQGGDGPSSPQPPRHLFHQRRPPTTRRRRLRKRPRPDRDLAERPTKTALLVVRAVSGCDGRSRGRWHGSAVAVT